MTESKRPCIVVPGDEPMQIADSAQLERLRPLGDVRIYRDRPGTQEEQLRRAHDADVLLNSRGHVKWPAELLAQLPRLRMITTCAIGTDSIDVEAAAKQGIVVSNIPGRTSPIVAEHALGLMLATARRLAYQTSQLKAGVWNPGQHVWLAGKTLGVIGAGAIGREVIRLGTAIGMRVQVWTFRRSEARAAELGVPMVELDALLRTSDVISLHVRLSPQTRGLIGRRELELMKPGALLVNTARGAVVDTEALVAALQRGHLGGAGLDVFDREPLAADHPLLNCDQVVLTPHNADQTPEGIDRLNAGAVDNVIAFLQGSPQNVVQPN